MPPPSVPNFIKNIIEAIHIATFIVSSAYFFSIDGRSLLEHSTQKGAIAGLYVGAVVQILLVIKDLVKTPPMAPAYLESISPLLLGHGVIPGILLSGTAFILVSLYTKPAEEKKMGLFFGKQEKNKQKI